MAFGMKRWSALVAVLLTAVLWLAVPPQTVEELQNTWGTRRQPVLSPQEQHRDRLTDAVRRTNMKLQTLRWADSLRPLVLDHGTDGVLLGLTAPDRPATEVEEIRSALAREIPREAPGRAAVGVFFLPSGASAHPGALTTRLEGYYFGEESGTPYCFAARSRGGPPGDERPTLPYGFQSGEQSLTGVCRWIHRYGLPGQEMRAWMEGPGTATAAALEPFDGSAFFATEGPHRELRRRGAFGLPGGITALLGGSRFFWILEPSRDRCLAGDAEACLETTLAGSEERFERGPGVRHGTAFTATDTWPMWRQSQFLMTTLEREFGEERFRAFWTSDAPVPRAFQAAFGEPMDAWLLAWYDRHAEIVPPGPSPRLAGLLGTLVVLLLAGMVATWFVRRWRVTE